MSLRLDEEREEVPLVTLVLVPFFGQEGVPGAWLGATDKTKEVALEKRSVLGLEKRLRREQVHKKEVG